jgi:hypothetical protein
MSCVVATAAGCGDDDAAADAEPIVLFDASPPDAGVPDAFVCTMTVCGTQCVDTTSDPLHCGGCGMACTPVSDCETSDCVCPTGFVPNPVDGLFEQMDTMMAAPNIIGISVFSGGDGAVHLLLVGWDPALAPIGTDIDLSDPAAPVFVGVGYDVDIMSMNIRGGYFAVGGTLHLDRACAQGVAGTITGGQFAEADLFGMTLIPDGCTLTLDAAFDISDACPLPDAGP